MSLKGVPQVRSLLRPLIAGLFCVSAGAFGCAKVPPCTVSPVDIEETREDSKILEKDLLAARARAKELSTELAGKKAEYDIDARRGKKKKDKDEEEKETA
jgi:hypothetical protein